MSLVARHLEGAGFVTVVIGSAQDIVEQAGVPRFVYTDFPLGNSIGRPWDAKMQTAVLTMALELAQRAFAPRTTVTAPFSFDDNGQWRNTYLALSDEQAEELKTAGEARRQRQQARKSNS